MLGGGGERYIPHGYPPPPRCGGVVASVVYDRKSLEIMVKVRFTSTFKRKLKVYTLNHLVVGELVE